MLRDMEDMAPNYDPIYDVETYDGLMSYLSEIYKTPHHSIVEVKEVNQHVFFELHFLITKYGKTDPTVGHACLEWEHNYGILILINNDK